MLASYAKPVGCPTCGHFTARPQAQRVIGCAARSSAGVSRPCSGCFSAGEIGAWDRRVSLRGPLDGLLLLE